MFRMTPRILANLFSGPATRGRLVNDIAQCNFCGACAVKCPTGCLTVDRHGSRWTLAPHICIGCGVCVETCPRHCLHQASESGPPADRNDVVVVMSS